MLSRSPDSSRVYTLVAAQGALYVGGFFDSYRGVSHAANNLAKLDMVSGEIDTAFSPPGQTANGFDWQVTSLAVAGAAVYAHVGWDHAQYRGVPVVNPLLVKLDRANGTLDGVFHPISSGDVAAYGHAGGKLLIGGVVSIYPGGSLTYLSLVDAASGETN